MWLIQTPVDGLLLPSDTAGRVRPTGKVPAWHNVVRLRDGADATAASVLAETPLQWEIRPWHQIGHRLYLQEATAQQDSLLQMVRENAGSVCTMATFPRAGRRSEDRTVHLTIVTPPERFAQYESLVRFAMTLPLGSINITLPTPWITDLEHEEKRDQTLIMPGSMCLLEEIAIAVSRAPVTRFSEDDLRPERRPPMDTSANRSIADDDCEWLTFRRDDSRAERLAETNESQHDDSTDDYADDALTDIMGY